MAVKLNGRDVPWVGMGESCFVYEITPLIVVKVRRPGEVEEEKFVRDAEFHQLLRRHPPCPRLVTCFFSNEDVIFLEYMKDIELNVWLYGIVFYSRDPAHRRLVIAVKRREPLALRLQWMVDIAEGVAFLESIGFAHGDLQPENVLVDRGRLKLADFNSTAEFGVFNEWPQSPWARLHGNINEDTYGSFSPQSEQYSLGSLFYVINYGIEPYSDRILDEKPCGEPHDRVVHDLMQELIFPELHGTPAMDVIIDDCWHSRYATIAELVEHLARTTIELVGFRPPTTTTISSKEFTSRRAVCKQMVQDGIAEALSAQNPWDLKIGQQRNYLPEKSPNLLPP